MPTIDDVRKLLVGNTSKDPRQRVNEVIALCEEQPVTKTNDTLVHESSKKVTLRRGDKSD